MVREFVRDVDPHAPPEAAFRRAPGRIRATELRFHYDQ
jgi:hypothetical protein